MVQSQRKTIFDILGREPVHPFPARMAPDIALEVIPQTTSPLRILDPMMGSGTVLAVARSKGHRAIGIDIDPLAVLISKVWTTAVDVEAVRTKAQEVLDRAGDILKSLQVGAAYPKNADDETRQFIRYWFDPYSRRQLTALAIAISRVQDVTVKDVLWCGFSRLIITKQSGASLALDLAHSRPHKRFARAPSKPFRKFVSAVERVVENCIDANARDRGPATQAREGDARNLPVEADSVDLVLTSPPYLNAIDYMRCSKFSLVWMGHGVQNLRDLRSESVGSEAGRPDLREDPDIKEIIHELKLSPKLDGRHEAVLARYIDDMRVAVSEVARVLVPGGKAVYVVGENTIRGTYIRNSEIVSAVAAGAGLKLEESRRRSLPGNRRYLPPPRKRDRSDKLDARMRREVVLAFQRSRTTADAKSNSQCGLIERKKPGRG